MADREAVECLYCGAEMNPDRTFKSMLPPGVDVTFWYLCGECCATSPRCETRELAYAAAMTRYQEKNRVLTLEEVNCIENFGVWIERYGVKTVYFNAIRGAGVNAIHFVSGWAEWIEEYGRTWRIWLRRPTGEEREAIAWN